MPVGLGKMLFTIIMKLEIIIRDLEDLVIKAVSDHSGKEFK